MASTECASAYSCGSFCASAPSYGRSEDIGIAPIVVAELKFRDVQRHIFLAHFVECADHAALEDRPEAFNRIRVDCADNVLVARATIFAARDRRAAMNSRIITVRNTRRELAGRIIAAVNMVECAYRKVESQS